MRANEASPGNLLPGDACFPLCSFAPARFAEATFVEPKEGLVIANKWTRIGLAVLFVLVAAGVRYLFVLPPAQSVNLIPISQLGQDVQLGTTVQRISVNGAILNVTYRDGVRAVSTKVTPAGNIEETLN